MSSSICRLGNQLAVLPIATFVGVMLSSGLARAVPIVVPNFSFEDNVAGDGNYITSMDDWTIVTTGLVRTYNPKDAQFSGTTTTSGGTIPSPGEGTQIALSNLDAGEMTSLTSESSLGLVEAGATYTLTVAGGNRAGSGGVKDPDQYTIQILVDGMVAASTVRDGNTISDDSFEDISTSFTALAGQAEDMLTVRLIHTHVDGSTATGHFDNVRLDFFTVPEPSTALLLGLGGFGLIRLTRRKKKREQSNLPIST